jgi:hypothetical protein
MSFHYQGSTLWLDDIVEPVVRPRPYRVRHHAGRMTPPVGWTLVDRRRTIRPLFASLEVA